MSSSSCLPVAGVWQRAWEEDPLGSASSSIDRTTLVLWIQTPNSGIYIDLRLPLQSPGRSIMDASKNGYSPRPTAILADGRIYQQSSSSPDDNEQDTTTTTTTSTTTDDSESTTIDILFQQKSFAGRLEYTIGDTTDGTALKKDEVLSNLFERHDQEAGSPLIPLSTCFWKREIDYQPPCTSLDIGVCIGVTSDDHDMRETGADGSYAEGWKRIIVEEEQTSTTTTLFLAMELVNDKFGRKGYWIRVGNKFAYAIGRPTTEKDDGSSSSLLSSSSKISKAIDKSLYEALNHLVVDRTTNDTTTNDSNADKEKKKKMLERASTYIACFGHVKMQSSEDLHIEEWNIDCSTHPELVGCNLVQTTTKTNNATDDKEKKVFNNDKCCSTLMKHEIASSKENLVEQILASDDNSDDGVVRLWRVVEQSKGCELPIHCG